VTLLVRDPAPTLGRLERWAGLDPAGDGTMRGRVALGGRVTVAGGPGVAPARMGAGTVHHVAFRAEDGEEQLEWLRDLRGDGADVSPVMDRDYFTSIYFREPGGVLLEVATDGPGFARDESPDALGTALRLPAWVEDRRDLVERALPALGPARPLGAGAAR
jgi:glyoxalase family protein